ncbi:GGDEF domain-containing protein, partial [Rhizobium ruizarguesonis]
GRTRDIRLNGELARLFGERSCPRTAKIIRALMVWVIVLDVLTLGLNAILLPIETVMSMLLPASILPPSALVAAIAFLHPQSMRPQEG